jgi:hypothetical protein
MRRIVIAAAAAAVLSGCLSYTALATESAQKALATSAREVIDRNVAARGGLDAWRRVDTMMWFGHLERGGRADGPHIPFVMQLQRPNRTRFEIKEQYNQFTRVFDGAHGWRVRPGNNGQADMKSFSKEEVDFAREEFAIDGPLIDYAGKGVTANLDGIDILGGRKAYRLSIKLASGAPRKVWIDVKTNLEIRYDRPATSPLAPGTPVSVYYGDYDTVESLTIPHSIVVGSGPNSDTREGGDRLVIDRMIVNPKLDDQAFLPPPTPLHRGGKILIPSDGTPTGARGRSGI